MQQLLHTALIFVGGFGAGFLILLLWCCVRLAGRADRQIRELFDQ